MSCLDRRPRRSRPCAAAPSQHEPPATAAVQNPMLMACSSANSAWSLRRFAASVAQPRRHPQSYNPALRAGTGETGCVLTTFGRGPGSASCRLHERPFDKRPARRHPQSGSPRGRATPMTAASSRSAARASTTSRTSTSRSRATSSWCSPACRARANPRSPSTPSTPRASAAMSKSLSAYARQFLEMMQKPDVDQIDGLSPAISIEQKTTSQQPALDRRHRHRDLRLHAAAVGARRRALFARHRPADREPDRVADGRPRAGAAGGHAHLSAGAGRARPQGRVPQGARRVPQEGLPARQDRRRVPRDRRGASRSTRSSPTTSTWWSTAWWCAPDIATRLADSLEQALKLADGMAVVELADSTRRPAPRPTSGATRTPSAWSSRRNSPARCRASPSPEIEPRLFSFNNPFGACPKCGGLGVEQHIDADLVIPDKDAHPAQGRDRAVGESSSPYYTQTLDALGKHYRSRSTPSGRTCRRRRRTRSSTAPATTRSSSPTTTACAPTRPRSRSRASSPISSAAARRPRATGRARSCRNISPTSPATPATASGSSPRRCASRSRAAHRRGLRAVGQARRRVVHRAAEAAHRQAERDRRAACSRKSATG